MIHGVITRVGTLVDKTVRLTIDCPPEMCPGDIINWQYEEVMIDKEDQGNGEANGKQAAKKRRAKKNG